MGSYCGSGSTCVSDCGSNDDCDPGNECNDRGQCQAGTPDPDIDSCVGITVVPEAVVPTVHLLIDHSGSMEWNIIRDDTSTEIRIVALDNALLASADSVVPRLQSKVRFGASLYAEHRNDCPWLSSVDPALDNYQTIDDAIGAEFGPTQPSGGTPTGPALAEVAAELALRDPSEGPRIIVLATDGEPNTCASRDDTAGGRQQSEDAVAAAFDTDGIETYVLSVGSEVSADHLQRLANLGRGKAADEAADPAPYYQALSAEDLVAAFDTIVRGVRSCSFDLTGDLANVDRARGAVTLDGTELVKDVDWQFESPARLRLLGATCDSFLDATEPALEASFPCKIFIP
ncbi:VWA domain-containing protein [Haliangium sp.]|uniref:VWA domain-containing protein n=1 Tax=Haliangium sp. TaxID=2663208 RepID=UPI003D0AE385